MDKVEVGQVYRESYQGTTIRTVTVVDERPATTRRGRQVRISDNDKPMRTWMRADRLQRPNVWQRIS